MINDDMQSIEVNRDDDRSDFLGDVMLVDEGEVDD
jgi:hypothetical protein